MRDGDEKAGRELYVQSLGTLNIQYGEESLSLNTLAGGKVIQLLILLVMAGEDGVSRVQLQDALYNRRKTDAANALRITSSRLRKLLAQIEPTAADGRGYIWVRKNTYYLGGDGRLTARMDAVVMEECYTRAAAEADQDRRRELLEQGCELYRGEFLPSMSGEAWVELLRSHYQDVYFKCVRELCDLLNGQGDYEKMLRISSEALNLYPTEEWAQLKMKCLVALKRYKESVKVYDEAAKKIYAEMGMVPSHRMLEQLHAVADHIQHQDGDLAEIKKVLAEENPSSGAYCYTYPGFIDCFRMEVRIAERGKRNGALIVCTVLDGKGYRVENTDKLSQYAEILDEVIRACMRRSDIYTQYNREQRLILANGLKADKFQVVENRLAFEFRRRCGQKAQLQIQSIPLDEWLPEQAASKQKRKGPLRRKSRIVRPGK